VSKVSEEAIVNVDAEVINKLKEEMNAEIEAAQKQLVSDGVQKEIEAAAEKAKEDARIQFEKEQLAKEQEEKIKALEEQLKNKEKESHDQIEQLKNKVDEMVGSKAVYSPADNPLNGNGNNNQINVDRMTPEEVQSIEDRSRELFLQKTQR
jgi:hypothetical protein